MDDALAVQGGHRRQAAAQHGDGDARLQAQVLFAVGHGEFVDVVPALAGDGGVDAVQEDGAAEALQVVAVDPLHLEQADTAMLDEVVHVDQVVLLNPRDAAGDRGEPPHFGFVSGDARVGRGRKDFERDPPLKTVGPLPLAQKHDSLTARSQAAQEGPPRDPNELLPFENRLVAGEKRIRTARRCGRFRQSVQSVTSLFRGLARFRWKPNRFRGQKIGASRIHRAGPPLWVRPHGGTADLWRRVSVREDDCSRQVHRNPRISPPRKRAKRNHFYVKKVTRETGMRFAWRGGLCVANCE